MNLPVGTGWPLSSDALEKRNIVLHVASPRGWVGGGDFANSLSESLITHTTH